MDEEHSKVEGRGEMSETELLIMDQFTVLVRDLYAFYPLLIRFVDYNRYTALSVCLSVCLSIDICLVLNVFTLNDCCELLSGA